MSAWLLLLFVLLPAEAVACATCISGPWDKPDWGFFWSALFLMGVPVVAAGTIGGWLYYHSRRGGEAAGEGITRRFAWTRFLRMRKENRE